MSLTLHASHVGFSLLPLIQFNTLDIIFPFELELHFCAFNEILSRSYSESIDNSMIISLFADLVSVLILSFLFRFSSSSCSPGRNHGGN